MSGKQEDSRSISSELFFYFGGVPLFYASEPEMRLNKIKTLIMLSRSLHDCSAALPSLENPEEMDHSVFCYDSRKVRLPTTEDGRNRKPAGSFR